jgi:hypothetical protein
MPLRPNGWNSQLKHYPCNWESERPIAENIHLGETLTVHCTYLRDGLFETLKRQKLTPKIEIQPVNRMARKENSVGLFN